MIKAHMNGTDPNGNDVVAIYPMLKTIFASCLYLTLIIMQRVQNRKIMRILMIGGKKK